MFYKKNKIKNSDKSSTKSVIANKGVTLLEVVVIIGIFGMLLSVVMFKYTSFNNNIVLTNTAYEVALSIREAQFFGTAVKGYGEGNNEFEKNIGLNFVENSNSYTLYVDTVQDNSYVSSVDFDIDIPSLQRGMLISELRICGSQSQTILDIVFDRPNPEPILPGNASSVQITISTPDLTNHRYVTINSVGAIDVLAESCQ